MLKRILLLGLVFVLCIGTAGFADIGIWGSHTTWAQMKGLKGDDPYKGEFRDIRLEMEWYDEAGKSVPEKGVMSIDVKSNFTFQSWGGYKKDFTGTGEKAFDLRFSYKEENTSAFLPVIEYRDGGGYEFGDLFMTGAETAIKSSAISIDFEGVAGTFTKSIPAFKTTAEQLADKAVPYVELLADAKGFITGAKARIVDPTNVEKALIAGEALKDMKNWNWGGVVRVGFSVDGTKNNIRDGVYFVSETGGDITPGQELSFTNKVTKGLEGVIHKDRVTYVRVTYYKNDPEWLRYEWCFNNWVNVNNLGEKINVGGESPVAPDKTEINVVSVNVGSDYNIPNEADLKIEKAGDGTIAVNEAHFKDIQDGTARLVKAAVFEVKYGGAQDGKQVLPTTMKFSATKSDIGSAVWEKIKSGEQDTILEHVRVFKIIPAKDGTKTVDLAKDVVAKADWGKVFSAQIDGDNVNITANIMIRDAADGAKFEGVKDFGSMSYIMYVDGSMNGKFEDPIALFGYENVPTDEPTNNGGGGGGGCSAGYFAPFALLFAAPLFFKKKK